jgi:hypothetical protein
VSLPLFFMVWTAKIIPAKTLLHIVLLILLPITAPPSIILSTLQLSVPGV